MKSRRELRTKRTLLSISDDSRFGMTYNIGDCEFFDVRNHYCSIGDGKCLLEGDSSKCKMLKYYYDKLNSVRPKTFGERYPDWRKS